MAQITLFKDPVKTTLSRIAETLQRFFASLLLLLSRLRQKAAGFFKSWIYKTCHEAFFLVQILLGACLLIGIGFATGQGIALADAVFMAASAGTATGLNSVPLSTLTTGQQAVLYIWQNLGSTTFEAVFNNLLHIRVLGRNIRLNDERQQPVYATDDAPPSPFSSSHAGARAVKPLALEREDDMELVPIDSRGRHVTFSNDVESISEGLEGLHRRRRSAQASRGSFTSTRASHSEAEVSISRGTIGDHGWIARNSDFQGLEEDEQQRFRKVGLLGLKIATCVLVTHFLFFQIIGLVVAYCVFRHYTDELSGQSPIWSAIFSSNSAYTNGGMMLNDDGMVAFQKQYGLLIVMMLQVLAGNTALPIFWRWETRVYCHLISVLAQWSWLGRRSSRAQGLQESVARHVEAMDHFLDHPRRYCTHLFPKMVTWALLVVLTFINACDAGVFWATNANNAQLASMGWRDRVAVGIFQSLSVRASGLGIVPLSIQSPACMVSYIYTMCIAPYPVAMSIRQSNQLQEQSLGIHENEVRAIDERASRYRGLRKRLLYWIAGNWKIRVEGHFLWEQLARQVTHDLPHVLVSWIIICILEHFFNPEPLTTGRAFMILFEVVSAFSNVGLSYGTDGQPVSLCASWHWSSKLVLAYVMYRGAQRGLPVAMDHAIELPDQEVTREREERDGGDSIRRRIERDIPAEVIGEEGRIPGEDV